MGNIYSNHLHFLSYLLKCPVDKAGNSFSESLNLKLFWGVCPHADPPTLERLRPSNFFPLRTPSKSHATSLQSIIRISKTCLSRRFLESIFQVRHYQPETFIVQIWAIERLTILKIHARESAITSVSSITEFLNANGPDSLSETATVSVKQIL